MYWPRRERVGRLIGYLSGEPQLIADLVSNQVTQIDLEMEEIRNRILRSKSARTALEAQIESDHARLEALERARRALLRQGSD